MQLDGSRICWALNLDRYEYVEVLSRICRQQNHLDGLESVEKLSVKQKFSWWIENLSRNYWDKFQIARWIEITIRSVEKRSPKGSIDSNLLRIYREAVELDKRQFFKERKNTKRWMQSNKLLNIDLNNILSFQKHLSTKKKMQSIHRSKTDTLNKSNQFYILKTSQNSLVSIH